MHEQPTAFENIVGKEEIACNEQFLLFLQCFQPNQIIVSGFVHIFGIIFLFAAELEEPKILSQIGNKTLWEKGENSGNQHFLLFPQCFLLLSKKSSF